MRRTIGSCSARPRLPPPLLDGDEDAGWGVPPGSTFTLAGRLNAPLNAAIITPLASAPSDMSMTAADAVTLITNSLPSSFHSPGSSMESNMHWLASARAFNTISRIVEMSVAATGSAVTMASDERPALCAGAVAVAGAADPMTTRGGAGADTKRGPDAADISLDNSGFPLRAVSAEKGET